MNIINGRECGPQPQSYFLKPIKWDDYSYWTSFILSYYDAELKEHRIGETKIAYKGQGFGEHTSNRLSPSFASIELNFYSLGQNPEYYQSIIQNFGLDEGRNLLCALRDVVADEAWLLECQDEPWFASSLKRYVSFETITGQFSRILSQGSKLERYGFVFADEASAINLEFEARPHSKPPSNMHVLTGRNGSGKTSTLKRLAKSIIERDANTGRILDTNEAADEFFFSRTLYASFSVFDNPLAEIAFDRADDSAPRSLYIGLYKENEHGAEPRYRVKSKNDLAGEFSVSIKNCVQGSEQKREVWREIISILDSDVNFFEYCIAELADIDDESLIEIAATKFTTLSSGHAAVLYSLTKIVELVEEKTIVIFDEPENHLHPPLLSAFVRALSKLLADKNGIAIMSTHSPVVAQEVPASCVWKIDRFAGELTASRPSLETFAENVGTLTHEVFGLEVNNSGFYALLDEDAREKQSYDEVLTTYGGNIGFEGRLVLRALLSKER